MSKLSKRDHVMPGWVSNGPVQINVGRDLHIHGGCSSRVPDDAVMPRRDYGPHIVFALGRVWAALLWLVGGLLQLAAWVTFGVLALGYWLVCRAVDVLHSALRGGERVFGGGPTRLVYVPSFLRRDFDDVPLQLGSGERVDQLTQLESDYEHSN